MDSLTHIAIGACLGEAIGGKTLGKKAWVWGAFAHSLPDMDVLAMLWMDTPHGLLAHRGITHSFLCTGLLAALLAWLAWRRNRQSGFSLYQWLFFLEVALCLHPLLDVFNNYGVAWFEPFSSQRISVNALYVADPFFTAGPLPAFLATMYFKKARERRWWRWGLIWSACYLLCSLFFKYRIDQGCKKSLEARHIAATSGFSTPAPLQNLLWFVVAGVDSGYFAGYRSVFETDADMEWTFFPINDSLLGAGGYAPESLESLKQFSQGFYTIEKWSDTLVFNDLRFGQELGWQQSRGHFAFHYFLNFPYANRNVVQRGRFAGWDASATRAMWRRIRALPPASGPEPN